MTKILIVEDNEHMHRIYVEKFRREGFAVLDAFDGEEGLLVAKRERPAVVLLDLMMPKMDGYQVLQQLKIDPQTESIPVLVTSNKCQPVDIERAYTLGARSFFHKGMTSLDDIAVEVRKACHLRKALLISSRPPVVSALMESLGQNGFLCSVIALVMEIIPRAERERPEVILLDTRTPSLNIHVVLNLHRANPRTRTIPIVLVDEASNLILPADCDAILGQLSVPIESPQLQRILKSCEPVSPANATAVAAHSAV